jgi:hypothetical protein
MLVFVKENVEVPRRNGPGMFKLNASKQLGHFFNSYAQAINKAYNRTGPLFESPFERKLDDNNHYILALICYCHRNAQLHGFTEDFREWEFSSYDEILNLNSSLIKARDVIQCFGSIADFENSHMRDLENKEAEKYFIEK